MAEQVIKYARIVICIIGTIAFFVVFHDVDVSNSVESIAVSFSIGGLVLMWSTAIANFLT